MNEGGKGGLSSFVVSFGSLPLKYYWFGILAVSVLYLFILIAVRDANQCPNGWLANLATLFNNIPEVASAAGGGNIKCLISLCYGLSLVLSPIFGLFINFCSIDFHSIEKFIKSKSYFGVILSWLFMLLLSIAPFTFGNHINLSGQFSSGFFGMVFASKYPLYFYSISFLVAFSFIWFYIFYFAFRLFRRKS